MNKQVEGIQYEDLSEIILCTLLSASSPSSLSFLNLTHLPTRQQVHILELCSPTTI